MYNFHTYKDNAGQWRWRLVAANGRIVADSSEGYSSLSEVRGGRAARQGQRG
jgi:hypothetical protein